MAEMRVLVGGVGYRDLRDYSFGVRLSDALASRAWSGDVTVEDISYNPLAVVQRLQDDPPARRFGLAVVIGAAHRAHGVPGDLRVYRWNNELPPDERVQAAVAEAVTGVIALDNTLVLGRYWQGLPEQVVVVEVEPAHEEFGDEFSPPVAAAFARAQGLVIELAEDPARAADLPLAPLGGTDPDVLALVERAVSLLERHPDHRVREAVGDLTRGLDAVHRAGLTHLVQALRSMAGEALLNRLVADPAIRLLLMSYNLIAVDRRLMAEEALDVVRAHLHAHGIDVEVTGVLGGVVSARVHARHGADAPALPLDAVRRDLEAALREHFIGFQELTFADRPSETGGAFVPVALLKRAHRPVYADVLGTDDLADGAMRAIELEGVPVLLVNLGGDIHAVHNRCGDTPLPLQFGALTGAELQCSWHGCRYDVRSGRRIDAAGASLRVYPVAVADGRIRIACGVAPAAATAS